MFEEPNENTQPQPSPETPSAEKKLSAMAKWAFILCMTGTIIGAFSYAMSLAHAIRFDIETFMMCFIPLIFFFGFWLGIFALLQIGYNRDKLKGIPRSLISVLIPVILFIGIRIVNIIIPPEPHPIAFRLMCETNLKDIDREIRMYAHDYSDKLPAASNWCDLLVKYTDLPIKRLVCPRTDDLKGESSYAMNKYIADMNLSQLPKDIVVLFETDYGRTEKRGWWKLYRMRANNEEYYQVDNPPDLNSTAPMYPSIKRSDKLDKLHWNEFGGPEILSLNHHGWDENRRSCNVLLGDGSILYIPEDEVPNLRWKP